jgi:FtsZ-interacting cell division protein YlmF
MTHEPTVVVTLRESDARRLLDFLNGKEAYGLESYQRIGEELKHALAECDCADTK